MKRRQFLSAATAGAAAAAATSVIAKPAIAQNAPTIKWRLSSAFQPSLDILWSASELFAKVVSDLTDGKFQIQTFPAGEIVGTAQALDAAINGTVEIIHTASYYYVGKDPTFSLFTAQPFGLNTRQLNAWILAGGGQELADNFFKKFGLVAFPGGNTGTQMGGWFRKEIKTVEDLKGLKMRIPGLGGEILSKLGVLPQQIPPADIYPSLERGTIDAVEFVGPYDDEKLGFVKVAPFYYYPGWWEGSAGLHFMINDKKFAELPKTYQDAVKAAAAVVNQDMIAKYDARNPGALRRLLGSGATLRAFSQEIMEASYKASQEVFAEISAKNEDFKKVIESTTAFRNEEYLWFQVAEYSYDNFMIRQRRTKSD
ncbi:TRAP transporter substrate-binding protein [Microvirga sp. W0021]|uniref:TRAP transporter substrate-binding protein n=1 Tax=Hohaiivirga grylli TaxID=3133970 RepID=A0ABV0BHJ2_9HYPH